MHAPSFPHYSLSFPLSLPHSFTSACCDVEVYEDSSLTEEDKEDERDRRVSRGASASANAHTHAHTPTHAHAHAHTDKCWSSFDNHINNTAEATK